MSDDQVRLAQAMEASTREFELQQRQLAQEEDAKLQEALAASLADGPSMQRATSADDGALQLSPEIDITHVFGLISKHGGERLRLFGLEHGVKLLLKHPDGCRILPRRVTLPHFPRGYVGTTRRSDRVLMQIEGTRTALEIAEPTFRCQVLDNPGGFRAMCHARWSEEAFVFADNSNIFMNAQYTRAEDERDYSIRVSVPRLCDVVRAGRHPKAQVVVGSHGGRGVPSWQPAYEKEGFMVHVEERRGGREQMVDDVLHAHSMQALTKDFGKGRLSQTLILLTGNGNGNGGRTTFPDIVVEAMKHNALREANGSEPLWNVEIVSWQRSLSSRMKDLRDQYPGYVSIRWLDQYRDYLTWHAEQL